MSSLRHFDDAVRGHAPDTKCCARTISPSVGTSRALASLPRLSEESASTLLLGDEIGAIEDVPNRTPGTGGATAL